MTAAGLGFGFVAGVLSILSPCVLPVLPLVMASAASAHRFGPFALTLGLISAFVGVGLFVATLGSAIGLDDTAFRAGAAVLLALFGAVLLSEGLERRFALAVSGFGGAAGRRLAALEPGGPAGQFLTGVLLGAVWSPCVGPTLGAASLLASERRDLAGVAGVMAAFAIGTALPLLVLGRLSHRAFTRWRARLAGGVRGGKLALGVASIAVAALILTGADHAIEAALVSTSPAWLTDLTTRY